MIAALIENDELVFIHTTTTTTGEQPEAFASSSPDSNNQLAQYAAAPSEPTATSDPRHLSDTIVKKCYQYQNFIEARDGNAELVVSLDQARLAIALTLATYESTRVAGPVPIRS